jgi:hypothetical protein
MTTNSLTPQRKNKRGNVFSLWLQHWMFQTGIDPITWLVRLAVILIVAVFFVVPLLWLILATTKTNPELSDLPALAIGSLAYVPKA